MRNSNFMKGSLLLSLFVFLGSFSAYGREQEQRLQQISIYVDEIGYQLNHHKVEIDLFHERLKNMEEALREGLQEIHAAQTHRNENGKLKQLEEGQKALLADLKSLRNELVLCVNKQSQLEKTVQGQMKEVQSHLQKVLALLGGGDAAQSTGYYTVKAGDSLSLIAQNLKVSVQALKEANHLSNDHIYVGQKLKLP